MDVIVGITLDAANVRVLAWVGFTDEGRDLVAHGNGLLDGSPAGPADGAADESFHGPTLISQGLQTGFPGSRGRVFDPQVFAKLERAQAEKLGSRRD